jgi:NAD(P)-binding Rossmann-like domain
MKASSAKATPCRSPEVPRPALCETLANSKLVSNGFSSLSRANGLCTTRDGPSRRWAIFHSFVSILAILLELPNHKSPAQRHTSTAIMTGDRPWPQIPVGNRTHAEAAVVIIGAGISGLCTAIDLLKRNNCKNFIILEKSGGPGGTWRDNKYPGCCCDGASTALLPGLTRSMQLND